MVELSNIEIKRYASLFHQPESVVKSFAASCDSVVELEKNLYECGEDNEESEEESLVDDSILKPVSFDELLDNSESSIEEWMMNNMAEALKDKLSEMLGIPREILDENLIIKGKKIDTELFQHFCPFTHRQREKLNCAECPLFTMNFVPNAIRFSEENNITLREAVEFIKFDVYRNSTKIFKDLMAQRNKDK